MSSMHIREATLDDSRLILEFIHELAVYENAADQVIASKADIESSLFGEDACAKAIICEQEAVAVGFAVYFLSYSTWLGQAGLYLEDLYVKPDHRGSGAGKALLKYLAELAVANGYRRFEWSVLDWNKPAIDFYDSIGAEPQDEWIKYRLSGEALKNFSE